MAGIELHEEIEAPAAAAWERLSDFGGLAGWMPGVASCEVEGEGVGAVRRVGFPGGGGSVEERLESCDDAARSLSYSILAGPLPVSDYLATIRVDEAGPGRCRVDWTARFELAAGVPEESVCNALRGAYGGALKALKKNLEG
jgi:carbon monoxide dehydrogenase subunit G